MALKIKDEIEYIVDLGEILFNYGDFLENNHPLVPSSYCFEWWIQDYNSFISKSKVAPLNYDNNSLINISGIEALEISMLGIPLHPKFTYMWHDISISDVKMLSYYIYKYGTISTFECYEEIDSIFFSKYNIKNGSICLKINFIGENSFKIKTLLEILLIQHGIYNNYIYITEYEPLLVCLGLCEIKSTFNLNLELKYQKEKFKQIEKCNITTIEIITYLSGLIIKQRAPSRIGARMGRPEKSNIRKMSPAAQVLFPLSDYGGNTRNLTNASNYKKNSNEIGGKLILKLGRRYCNICKNETYKWKCECGNRTIEILYCKFCNIDTNLDSCPKCGKQTTCIQFQKVDIKKELQRAYLGLNIKEHIKTIKGVKELMNKSRTPEPLEKGILRSFYDVYMFKDGTIRYDMSDLPLTHFKASEINIKLDDLLKLGYTNDIYNKPVTSIEQIVNLFVQDIVISFDCAYYLLKITKYIDDLLVKYYHLNKYYNIKTIKELIGVLVIGLAPHTSAGILGRIIGFTNASVCFAHPFFHASKRRNCDGDEDCIMLLLDGLLNFSKKYLPSKRGGKMDAPLVLTTRINPSEIDKEAHNIDLNSRYPLDFYVASEKIKNPSEISSKMDLISHRLGTDREFEQFMYTQETENIAFGPKFSSYKVLETMEDKILSQLELAKKIRAVDASDVAERVLKAHFLPDILGNLRAFSKQKTRCVKCSKKFRRPPLIGHCPQCGGNVILTVHEGTVKKYVQISKKIAIEYNVSQYLKERIYRIEEDIESIFNNIKNPQLNLSNYM